jgi:hypothetical protein
MAQVILEGEKAHSPAEPLFCLFCVCQMSTGGKAIFIAVAMLFS